ncbi:hypothetical protein MMC25_001092 [Agyrium rufum]|nr:hypothetical protein [Agyrium rufum]
MAYRAGIRHNIGPQDIYEKGYIREMLSIIDSVNRSCLQSLRQYRWGFVQQMIEPNSSVTFQSTEELRKHFEGISEHNRIVRPPRPDPSVLIPGSYTLQEYEDATSLEMFHCTEAKNIDLMAKAKLFEVLRELDLDTRGRRNVLVIRLKAFRYQKLSVLDAIEGVSGFTTSRSTLSPLHSLVENHGEPDRSTSVQKRNRSLSKEKSRQRKRDFPDQLPRRSYSRAVVLRGLQELRSNDSFDPLTTQDGGSRKSSIERHEDTPLFQARSTRLQHNHGQLLSVTTKGTTRSSQNLQQAGIPNPQVILQNLPDKYTIWELLQLICQFNPIFVRKVVAGCFHVTCETYKNAAHLVGAMNLKSFRGRSIVVQDLMIDGDYHRSIHQSWERETILRSENIDLNEVWIKSPNEDEIRVVGPGKLRNRRLSLEDRDPSEQSFLTTTNSEELWRTRTSFQTPIPTVTTVSSAISDSSPHGKSPGVNMLVDLIRSDEEDIDDVIVRKGRRRQL